jgi:hypothetical protein
VSITSISVMDAALNAIKKMCRGTWDTNDQKVVTKFIGDVIGNDAISTTEYGTKSTFFGPHRLGKHPQYTDVVGERGLSILLVTNSLRPSRSNGSTPDRCQGTPREFLEDAIAIYLVYHHLRKHPDTKIHPLNLLECFCREAFLRDPLENPVFNIYYFPKNSQIYYVNCVPEPLEILDADAEYGLVHINSNDGVTTLIDSAESERFMISGRDPLFEEALEAFSRR